MTRITAFFLFIAVALNIVVLKLLKNNFTLGSSLCILAFGYFGCSVLGFSLRKPSMIEKRRDWLLLLVWAICLSFIISLFFNPLNKLNVSDVILAQSLAPAVGVLLSFDLIFEKNSLKNKIFNSWPLVILGFLVFQKVQLAGSVYSLMLVKLLLLFSITQIALRMMARRLQSVQVYTFGGVLVFVLILAVHLNSISFSKEMIVPIILSSISLFFIQEGYINGLKRVPASISNVIISAAVPLSFLISFETQKFSLLLTSGIYLVGVALIGFKQQKAS